MEFSVWLCLGGESPEKAGCSSAFVSLMFFGVTVGAMFWAAVDDINPALPIQ